MERDYKIIAIDFDGTLFETNYPHIVRPILSVIEMAKARQEKGDKLILWTCREGPELDAAIEACRGQGLVFDAVNDNIQELKDYWKNNPRKVAADEYWDDKNFPLKPLYEWYMERAIELILEHSEGGETKNEHQD